MARIFDEIETTAQDHAPGTYYNLLRFYSDIQIEQDPLSSDFIPISAVRPNPKLFAVGIIPPAVNIRDVLLDRSGTFFQVEVGALPIDPDQLDRRGAAQKAAGHARGSAAQHREARPILTEAFQNVMGRPPTTAELHYLHAVAYLESTYGKGWSGDMSESNNWGAVHCKKTGTDDPNCIDATDKDTSGKEFKQAFVKYETPTKGAEDVVRHIFIYRSTSKGLGAGGTAMKGSYIMRRQTYYGGFCPQAIKSGAIAASEAAFTSLKTPDKNEGTKACAKEAIQAHAQVIRNVSLGVAAAFGEPAIELGDYDEAAALWEDIKGKTNGKSRKVADDTESDWLGLNGSGSAALARDQFGKLVGTSRQAKIARALEAAQNEQRLEAQQALDAMKRTPPLRMLVNPQKFGVSGAKIVNDGNWGRTGPIIEHWGNDQDQISASGKLAGFYALAAGPSSATPPPMQAAGSSEAGGPGITRAARNFSKSWQNFQSLYLLYRNNGAMFLKDRLSRNDGDTNIAMLGSIYIYYDNILYVGSFDTFNLTETDQAPHTVEYSFEFKVRAAFVLDRTDDEYTYGAPRLFRPGGVANRSTNSTPGQQRTPTTVGGLLGAAFGTGEGGVESSAVPDPRIGLGITPPPVAPGEQ